MNDKFEIGKYYVARDGVKCLCLFDDLSGYFPWLFIRYCANGKKFAIATDCDGNSMDGYDSDQDIIGPWIEKPEIDWAAMPAWCKAVTKAGLRNEWLWWSDIPKIWKDEHWYGGLGGTIPPEYIPEWEGNWRVSLVIRPEPEVSHD